MEDKELKVMESRVREVMESCPQAETILEKLWPELKKQKWVDISEQLELRMANDGINLRYAAEGLWFTPTDIHQTLGGRFKFVNGRLYRKA